jgi:WD40 repeat protein
MSKSKENFEPPLLLDRILGVSTLSNASLAATEDLFYIAGCVVVRYNAEENKQKGFYIASKAISSISVSPNGKYLAIGERGNAPLVTVWDINGYTKLCALAAHKYGVGCMAFSPDSRYLVTVGFKSDKQLCLWDWGSERKLSTQKLGNKVNAVTYHRSGDYFVTAGDRHLKWWTVLDVLDGEAVSIEGKPASILEDQRHSNFTDVLCGSGTLENFTYCTTTTGVLSIFSNETRMVDKWVQLDSPSSYCLELLHEQGSPGLLVVGCANGIVRCFSPQTLQYIATLPLPSPLISYYSEMPPTSKKMDSATFFGACLAMRRIKGSKMFPIPKLATIYADCSIFIWDISDIYAISRARSFLFHRGCVWDIKFVERSRQAVASSPSPNDAAEAKEQSSLSFDTFFTCSSDNTIRMWNLDAKSQRVSKFRQKYSREMLHVIDLSNDADRAEAAAAVRFSPTVTNLEASVATNALGAAAALPVETDVCVGHPNTELPAAALSSKYPPRAIALHPHGTQLACGDKKGRLRIFDLSDTTTRNANQMQLHSAEILSLCYSPPLTSMDGGIEWTVDANEEEMDTDTANAAAPLVMLASAGRDRLIHVLNTSKDHSHIDTLDSHSSSVTTAKFTADGRRLLSCGGDKNFVFHNVNGPRITKVKSAATPNGAINGLAIDPSNKFAVTSGSDKKLSIWNLATGKSMRSYKSEFVTSELYKCDIDPSGNKLCIVYTSPIL